MDGLLSFLCLLCVLITPGHSLSCISCIGLDSCTGPSETCMPNYSCGVAYRETTEGGLTTKGYIQSCVSTSKCNKVGSISYAGGTMKMGISCCNTDNCTPTLPQLPDTNYQTNGLVCPSCQASYWCDQQTNEQCTGSEKTCVFQPSSSGSVMGCATSTLCDVGDYSYGTGSNTVVIQFFCFPATSSTATGTSCVLCEARNSMTCTSSLSVIPPNSKCSSAYVITTTNGVKSYKVIRSWSPVSKCNIAGSMTVDGTKYSMGISCCDGDGCTPSIPDTTSTSTVSNGVQCKTCASFISGSCETTATMTCTGQENLCMTYAQTVTTGSISSISLIRGCGTKSLCDAQNPSTTMNYETVVNNFICESTTINPNTTTPSNGGNGITSNGGNGITSNGGSGFTAPSTGGVVLLLSSTLTAMLILHQFNKDA